ncbi:MAG: phage portal protein [Cryomorphaceae bacterium]|nr:MAG: phage portal protein [Cryomorphaceae bacterium]
MKNPFKNWFSGPQRQKDMQTVEDNQLYAQMFDLLNERLPIWVGKEPKEFITKGYMYNDLVYSLVTLPMGIAKSIDWLAHKIVNEKAYREYQYAMKGVKSGKNYKQNLERAIHYKRKALEEVTTGPAMKFIQEPNGYQSLNEIVEEYFGWLPTVGNFYLYGLPREGTKQFASVHVAPAFDVEIIAGTSFDPILGYRLRNYLKTNDIIPKEHILHLKNWNPDFATDGRQLYGLSPLQAGARILTLDNMGIDTSTGSFQNNGVRALIHKAITRGSFPEEFTREQAEALKIEVDKWKGTKNAGGLKMTNAPIQVTEIGKSPVDLGVYTAMDKNAVRLCNLFQVPPELYLPGTTFSNKLEARKQLITGNILPKMDIFRDKMNRWIVDNLTEGSTRYHIDYDLFSIVELQDDLSDIANMYKGIDWVTDNEKRHAMNYDAIDSELANDLFIDPFKIPMSQASFDTSFDRIDDELKRLKSKAY